MGSNNLKKQKTTITDELEIYNERIQKVKTEDKLSFLYSQFEDTIFLKNITLAQYNELLFKFNNKVKSITKDSFSINNKKVYYSTIDQKQYQEFIKQLIQKANPAVQEESKNECVHFLSVLYEHLSNYNPDYDGFIQKEGVYKISLIPLGLLFCKATQFEKLKFFFDFYKVENTLVIDSYINYLLKHLVFISTYSLSYFVCEKNQFDFNEVCEDRVNDYDKNINEKRYLSLFARVNERNKLLNIVEYLIFGYNFAELNDENIKKIQLCQLTWDSFFDIYKNKHNEFWIFSSFLIRDFISSHYSKNVV